MILGVRYQHIRCPCSLQEHIDICVSSKPGTRDVIFASPVCERNANTHQSTELSVDNEFELCNISTTPPIVFTEFFAKCRRDLRAQQFDSPHHLNVR